MGTISIVKLWYAKKITIRCLSDKYEMTIIGPWYACEILLSWLCDDCEMTRWLWDDCLLTMWLLYDNKSSQDDVLVIWFHLWESDFLEYKSPLGLKMTNNEFEVPHLMQRVVIFFLSLPLPALSLSLSCWQFHAIFSDRDFLIMNNFLLEFENVWK